MGSRAVRKAIRRLDVQKEKEEAVPKAVPEEEQAEDEEEELSTAVPANPFAVLNETSASAEEEGTDEHAEPQQAARSQTKLSGSSTKKPKHKKKKRKPPKEDQPTPLSSREPTPTPTATTTLDEVDRAVEAISLKYAEENPLTTAPQSPSHQQRNAFLSISPKNLDANLELRKIFGKIVDAEARDAAKQSIHGFHPRVINRIKAMDRQRRNHVLMKPKDEWQLFAGFRDRMLSMDVVGRTEMGETEFKFAHSRRYGDIQTKFYIIALQSDGQSLMELLRNYPFHVDTCIVASEVFKHQGSLSEAADLIERAIMALDCGLHPQFNLSLGASRLPFKYMENRGFYLAIWHHMESLGRRGCWRTCLEFNKLLFAVEPRDNSYAALLAIDFAAMKAREYSYVIGLRDSPDWIHETHDLLNIQYTAALAEYMLEKDQKKSHETSTESLSHAIQRFPWLIAPLFFALKLSFPPDFPPTMPPSPIQSVYTELYLHRSKDLWSVSEISNWLVSTAKATASKLEESTAPTSDDKIPLNVARHLFVMNVPELLGHIPREYLAGAQLASDPLPPPDSVSPYEMRLKIIEQQLAQDRIIRDLLNFPERVAALPRGLEVEGEVERGAGEEDVNGEDEDEFEEGDDQGILGHIFENFRNAFSWFQSGGHAGDDEEGEEDENGLENVD